MPDPFEPGEAEAAPDPFGDSTSHLAHDLNNLFSVVIGSVGIVLEDYAGRPLDTEAVSLLQDALSAGRDGARLVDALLSCAGRQALRREEVEIGSLLESTLSVLERTVPPGIRLDADAPHDPAHAWVDPGRLRESLLNLAANACEAMPDGGPLGISVRRRGSPPQVEIRVTDHGQGIDPALLERVREPFFSTHSPRRGRGLGLSVVDGFARQSGGTLTIQSTCGVGTTVTLALPATPNG